MAYDERVLLREHGARVRPPPPQELLGALPPVRHRVLPRPPRLLRPDPPPVPPGRQRRAPLRAGVWEHAVQADPDTAVPDRREGGHIERREKAAEARDVVVRKQRRDRDGEGFQKKNSFNVRS